MIAKMVMNLRMAELRTRLGLVSDFISLSITPPRFRFRYYADFYRWNIIWIYVLRTSLMNCSYPLQVTFARRGAAFVVV